MLPSYILSTTQPWRTSCFLLCDDNGLINAVVFSEEMFYQLALMQFGSCRRLKLDPPPPLRTLLKLAVDAEPGTERSGLGKNEIVDVSGHNALKSGG
jgi:hypothetical protein